MKVLTAVNPIGWPGLGERCLDGELVWLPPRCGQSGCSCLRAFAGCMTHGLTPTARVELLETTPAQFLEMLTETVCENCWRRAEIPDLARTLIGLAARFRVGTVVARGPRGGVHALRHDSRPDDDE